MKANFVSLTRALTLVSLTFFMSFSVLAAGEGTHGGDGRMLSNKVHASVPFLEKLRESVLNYVTNLRAKKQFLAQGWENSEFVLLTSDALLQDISATPSYDFKRVRGACGYLADGFPRTASTRNGVPHDNICIDINTAQDLGLTASELAGIIVHEHIRHLPGNLEPRYIKSKMSIDTFHNYASTVAATYWDVQSPTATGECFVLKSGGIKSIQDGTIRFDAADLLLNKRVVSGRLAGESVSIKANFVKDQYGVTSILVTITYNNSKFEYRLPPHTNSKEPTVYWQQADFDLDVMPVNKKMLGRETSLICSTNKYRDLAPFRGSRVSTNMERDWGLKTNPETNEIEFTGRTRPGTDQ